jgi:hypothetical protein
LRTIFVNHLQKQIGDARVCVYLFIDDIAERLRLVQYASAIMRVATIAPKRQADRS